MPTDTEISEYYANLLILQYLGKPKAFANCTEIARLAIMNQLPVTAGNSFDLNSAVGSQLDVIGKYAGVSRNGYDFSGPIVLTDAEYRTLIRIAILQNSAGSSLADIQNLINIYFPGTIFVFDFLDMRMGYAIDSDAISVRLAEVFVRQGRLPKPMGVQLAALVYGPDLDHFFGFNRNSGLGTKITPFSRNSTGFVGKWLRNSDTISF